MIVQQLARVAKEVPTKSEVLVSTRGGRSRAG
jgi:hypothetical protein